MQIKKTILACTSVVSLLIVVIEFFGTYKLCLDNKLCINVLYFFAIQFFPFVSFFLYSLIIYFLPERFFRAWYKFALAWTTLAMVGIFFAPEYSNEFMYAITKGSVAFYTSVLFCIISGAILLLKLFQNEK